MGGTYRYGSCGGNSGGGMRLLFLLTVHHLFHKVTVNWGGTETEHNHAEE